MKIEHLCKIAAVVLGISLLANCTTFPIPQSLPEAKVAGAWQHGGHFSGGDLFEFKPDHRYTETVFSDIVGDSSTTHGHWEYDGYRVTIHPSRKNDKVGSRTLQFCKYKGKLVLIPIEPWATDHIYFYERL